MPKSAVRRIKIVFYHIRSTICTILIMRNDIYA